MALKRAESSGVLSGGSSVMESSTMSLKVDKPGEGLPTLRAAEVPQSLQVVASRGARVEDQVAVVTWISAVGWHWRRGWTSFGWRQLIRWRRRMLCGIHGTRLHVVVM